MKFFAQNQQDKFILRLFANKRNGTFVDIGAYDGVCFSNTFALEKYFGWSGICIEPNPEVFKQLKINRNCLCLQYCINNTKGVLKFLMVFGYGTMLSGLMDLFDKRHLERIDKTIEDFGGSKQIIDVIALPLQQILEENKIVNIDYCNIDVEGGEIGVLNSIDFSKIRIQVFTIENNYNTKVIKNYMNKKGYKLIARLGCDEVYEYKSTRYFLLIKYRLLKYSNYFRLFLKVCINKVFHSIK